MDLGIGSTQGSFLSRRFGRQKTNVSSYNFHLSHHWNSEKSRTSIGMKGSSGTIKYVDKFNPEKFIFTAWGPFIAHDRKLVGVRLGIILPYEESREVEYGERGIFLFHFRLGNLKSYYLDYSLFDMPALGVYPEPYLSFGFLNFGFGDESGATNFRIAYSQIQYEPAWSISYRFPFRQTPFILEFAAHIQEFWMLSFGTVYRFDMN